VFDDHPTRIPRTVANPREASRNLARPNHDVVEDRAIQGQKVKAEQDRSGGEIPEVKIEGIDLECSDPRTWPRILVEEVAGELAVQVLNSLYDDFDRGLDRAIADHLNVHFVGVVARWMAESGFTPGEINGGAQHVGITVFTTIIDPGRYMSKVLPVLVERKRRTGTFFDV